jgi:hypothetical protein
MLLVDYRVVVDGGGRQTVESVSQSLTRLAAEQSWVGCV